MAILTQSVRRNDTSKSLYIHIPFCARKCSYCDFYSIPFDADLSEAYIDAINSQIGKLDGKFSTIFIGGGTPSVLGPKLLKRLLKALAPKLESGHTEFTVEANPDSLDDSVLKVLFHSGVNRLSIGVQSLEDRKLKKLNRIHNAAAARKAVYLASKAGFSNISVDLIFGVWCESLAGWRRELDEAVRLPIKHISCYSLTYEKGTPLYRTLKNKAIRPIRDEKAAGMYEATMDLLANRGFEQYEISSFAKSGDFKCRHNINYWENGSYVGLGASAVSYVDGVRAKNVSSVKEYIKRCENGLQLIDSREKLSPKRRAKETAAIKIRTSDGIDFSWFKDKTGYDFQKLESDGIAELSGKGLIEYKKNGNIFTGIALTHKGYLFCDTVSSALL